MSTARNLTPLILGITAAPAAGDPAVGRLLAGAPAPVHETRADAGAGVVVVALAPGAVLDDDLAAELPDRADAGELPWPRVPVLAAVVTERPPVRVVAYRPYAGAAVWALSFVWPATGDPAPSLDRRTGHLTLGGRVLTPETDRFTVDGLRAGGVPGRWATGGADFATLALRYPQPDGGEWLVRLAMDGSRLSQATLVHVAAGEPPGDWEHYDDEAEQARRAYHDAWLAAQPRGRRWGRETWGRVWSSYDERSLSSHVTVRYEA